MKFWELVSAFRDENEILEAVLNETEWKEFKEYFLKFDQYVAKQDREILDKEVPIQLAKEVCVRSTLKFYLYNENGIQVLTSWQKKTNEPFEILNPLDVLTRFGGKLIEEVLERSVVNINT